MRRERPQALPDQEVERALGRLELVAGLLLRDHFGQDFFEQLAVVLDVVLGGHRRDRRAAGKLAHQDPPLVAHGLRVDVLVAGGGPGQAADVHPALVGEGAAADERLPWRVVHVDHLVDVAREFREVADRLLVEHLIALLQAEVGDHREQVGVAAPFAEAVDRALDLHGPRVHRGQGVGHGQPTIVVAVDAQRHGDFRGELADDLADLVGHGAAVGVAKDDEHGAGLDRGLDGLERVAGIGLPAVEEVLGVEDHLARGGAKVGDALGDHLEVLVLRGVEDLST